MERFLQVLKDFLQIRERLPASRSAALGVFPIILILIAWFFVTWGRVEVVTLPDGLLDTAKPVPEPGRSVESGTRLKIAGAKMVSENNGDDRFLLYQGEKFPLPFSAAEYDGGVSVKLESGWFKSRDLPPSSSGTGPAETSVSQGTPSLDGSGSSASVGRGGRGVPSAPPGGTQGFAKLRFAYERLDTRMFSALILPSPGDMVRSFPSLWYDRALARNVGISFLRVAGGFLVAFIITFPLGIIMGTFTKMRSMFAPLMTFSGYMPIPALVPLSVIFFGMTETQKIMFLALAFAIYLLPLIVRAVEDVDNVYLRTAYTLGATRFQVMLKVLLGIASPVIYDAMRLGFGVGWGYIILVEILDMGCGGVGATILISQRRSIPSHVYLVLLAIVGIAFITDKLWEIVGDYLFPYRRLKR